ncbi:SGNH/GDSL hydrolase family protein [Acinetobacter baumannii]|uniref:SGNH/GDSL hydrolase family protein n=1 Tax=Acinetobacter baumannii TaxID=470 RepID=UPI0022B4FF55|nr:SGNH/GDSL hydrolase family protein [Acinetobacter baumannii]
MTVPDKNAMIGPSVTESQFKIGLGDIIDYLHEIEAQGTAVEQIKESVANAVTSAPNEVLQVGYYTGTSNTSLISQDGPSAYAIQMPKTGFIKKIRTQLAGGPSRVRVQVYRPLDKGAKLIETRYYDVGYPTSEIDLSDESIHVEKNDLVSLAWVSGIFIRGKMVSTGDPLGNFIVTQTMTVGQQVAISRSRNSLEFQVDLLVDNQLVTTQNIDPLTRLAVGYGVTESIGEFKQGALNTPTTSGSFSFAYGNVDPLPKFGKLKQIKYTTRSISRNVMFRLCVLVPNLDGTYKVATVKQVVAPADSSGVVTATSDHFGEIFVPQNGYTLIAGTVEIDAPLAQVGIAGGFSYIAATDIQLNSNVQVSKNTNNQPISAEFTYETSSLNLQDRVSALENKGLTVSPPLFSTVMDSQSFSGTSLPADWSAEGWTVNEGLFTPNTGSWTTKALSTGSSALAKREYSVDITILDASTITGFCTDQIETEAGAGAVLIDCTQNKLILYKYNGSSAGTSVAEVSIEPIVLNSKYQLRIEKNGYFNNISLINKTTGATYKLEYSDTTTGRYVQMHGRAGFLHLQGGAKFNNYLFKAFYPIDLHVLFIGDSNKERAANVLPNMTWAFQLVDMRRMNGDAAIAARSGDETPNFLKRKEFDLMRWKPKYVVWALGTNDTDINVWRTNMAQNIADTLAIGAIPILCTQVPRGSTSNLHYQMDEEIRSGAFGNYKYIDLAKAVSLNNDGFTWNPAYNSGDNLHVNPAGQSRWVQQALIDAPELVR